MRSRNAVLLGGAVAGSAVLARRRNVDRTPLATLEGGERVKVETTDGAVLVAEAAHPADGADGAPTVVLAHCWGGDPANWAPVAAPLVAAGHRVIRWFQRGHGPSTVGSDGFAIERFGADAAEVLAAFDVRDAVLAGHSLGGMTAQAFAVGHPEVLAERVRALVLVATASGGLAETPLGRSSRVLFRSERAMDRALGSRYGHVLTRGSLGKRPTPAAVRATRDHFVGTPFATRKGVAEAMMAMDLRAARRDIDVPTTVVVGTRDTLTPPSHARGIAADIAGARLVVLPDAGHMLPMEAADELVDIIAGHHA